MDSGCSLDSVSSPTAGCSDWDVAFICIEESGACSGDDLAGIEMMKDCLCGSSDCNMGDMGGSTGGDDGRDSNEPACLAESTCLADLEAAMKAEQKLGPTCAHLITLNDCVTGDSADPCNGDDQYTELLKGWLACTCDNQCDSIAETSDTIIDPTTWTNPHLHSQFHAGTQFVIPGYAEDAFGSFFRYDMNDAQDSAWNKSPWDMFSAFPDSKYEWVEDLGRCMPFVKLEGDEGDMVMLESVEGVDIDCAMDFIMSEQHVRNEECMAKKAKGDNSCNVDEWATKTFGHDQSPHGFIRDIRTTLRKASGAAPPSEFDGTDSISFTYKDASGNSGAVGSTKLTYKKFLQADALANSRFNRARDKSEKVRSDEERRKAGAKRQQKQRSTIAYSHN